MNVLETQADFEMLWFGRDPTITHWIVYFTASWCKACKRLDLDTIASTAAEKGIAIYKCDETENAYTAGYCGVNGFPTFMLFEPQTIKSALKSSDTQSVVEWIKGHECEGCSS
jgi:hypothetical protein